MPNRDQYGKDVRVKAARLVCEHAGDYPTEWAATTAVSGRLGISPETLRKWVRQAEVRITTHTLSSRSSATIWMSTAHRGLPAPSRPSCANCAEDELVLVHLWQGNTVWSGDSCSGMIDRGAADAGSPCIDLGTLRSSAALFFGSSPVAPGGLTAGGEVLAGWQRAAGRPAEHVAYRECVSGPVHGGRHGGGRENGL